MHKIGIFYYSATGTTEEFANIIAKKISEKNQIEINKIKTNIEVRAPFQKFEILNLPDFSEYDIILIGGPVWAFSICPVVSKFIKNSKGFSNKKVVPFITMGLPFVFMGGTQTLKKINKLIKEKEGVALPGFIVNKLFHKVNELMEKKAMQIASMIENI